MTGAFDFMTNNDASLFGAIELIIPLLILTILIDIILVIIYLINIVNNPYLDNSGKLLWVVLILFTNFIGMLIYFFKNIWPESVKIEK